jgi:hypothetical protein
MLHNFKGWCRKCYIMLKQVGWVLKNAKFCVLQFVRGPFREIGKNPVQSIATDLQCKFEYAFCSIGQC